MLSDNPRIGIVNLNGERSLNKIRRSLNKFSISFQYTLRHGACTAELRPNIFSFPVLGIFEIDLRMIFGLAKIQKLQTISV